VTYRHEIEAALVRGPLDDGLIAAAVDFFRETEDMSYWHALCEVHRVVDAGHAARDLQRAARIMARGSPLNTPMLRQILAVCPALRGESVTVLLIEGSAAPTLARRAEGAAPLTPDDTVTVGARWIIRVVEEMHAGLLVATRSRGRKKGVR